MAVSIPTDIYESPKELVLIVPLWGVQKESVSLRIEDYKLFLRACRVPVRLREDFIPVKEECFWGDIEQSYELPNHIIFDKIHSTLSKENILTIILPKYSIPESIEVKVE